MSHFTVMVIGGKPNESLAPVKENNMGNCPKEFLKYKAYPRDSNEGQWFDSKEQAEEVLLDQYDEENAFWENPNAKWDWYELGGRWSNFLLLKSGKNANAAHKRDIDFAGMRAIKDTKARIRYRNVHAVVNGRAIPKWDEVRAKHPENIDAARSEYNGNPVIKDTRELLGFFEHLSEFDCSEDEYAHLISSNAYCTHAFLKDGQWAEKGRMGWFACVIDEKEPLTWGDQFQKLLDTVGENEMISIYDCHI